MLEATEMFAISKLAVSNWLASMAPRSTLLCYSALTAESFCFQGEEPVLTLLACLRRGQLI